MKVGKCKTAIAMALCAALFAMGFALPARAQSSSAPMLKLYVDPKTGQVFTKPGRGRSLLTEVPMQTLDTSAIEQRVEQKTQVQLDANKQQIQSLVAENAKLEQSNADLTKQVAQIQPAWRSYIDNFQNKFRVGALVYGDYRFYTHSGFQPQELENINNPGPGGNLFNSFDITRAYLNFYFFPVDGIQFRVTPDIYRSIAGGVSANAVSPSTQFSSNVDGSMNFRLKYALITFNKLFDNLIPAMKGNEIQAGDLPNPFIPWEEDLFGFRYVTLVPWNYYGLSSGQLGVQMQGPIKINEKQYADYGFGVYDNAKFSQYELPNTKQAMVRVSAYPFGAKWRFDGLGITYFFDYGYGNVAPNVALTSPFFQAPQAHIMRSAVLVHYSAENWGVVAEYDYGHNAFSSSNLFSGSGPNTTGTYANFNTMTTGFLNNGRSIQNGFDLMGHYHIPHTPLTVFGLWSLWHPNTEVHRDPLDFQRYMYGIQWQLNEYVRLALDMQNINYYHGQGNVSNAYVHTFAPVTFAKGTTQTTDAVPWDTHSIFLNLEFNY